MEWEPAAKVQTNDAGEYRALIGDAWVPVERAQKNEAGEYRVMRATAPEPRVSESSAAPTTRQKLQASGPMRFLQGMRDPIDAGAQLLPRGASFLSSAGGLFPNRVSNFFDTEAKRVDEMVGGNEREYQAARKAVAPKTISSLVTGETDPGFDLARLGGNVASPVNLAIAARVPAAAMTTVPRMAATGAVTGAAGGALTSVTDVSEDASFLGQKAAQVGLGAVTGAALTPVVAKALSGVATKAASLLEGADVRGARASLQVDEAIRKALAETGQTIEALPSGHYDALRKEVLASIKGGKQIDAAGLLRKQDFMSLGIPPLKGQVTRDPSQFAKERNIRAVPGVGEPVLNVLERQNQGISEKVSALGGGKAQESQRAGQLIADALSAADEGMSKQVGAAYKVARESAGRDMDVPLQGLAQDFAAIERDFGKAIPSAVRNRLAEFGVFDGKQTKVFTANDAEDVLRQINKLYDPSIKAEAGALDAIRAAVKRAITSADDQGGVFAGPRNLAKQRFDLHDAVPALKAAADGRISPDHFVSTYLVNGETKDVKMLAQTLKQANPQAFEEARNQIGATLLRAAFGENPSGDKLIRPESFAKALRTLGSEKLSAFYSPDEIAQMFTIARVGSYINTTPSAAPVLGNPNMAWAGPLLERIPVVRNVPAIANSFLKPISQARLVRGAVAADVPTTPAPGAQLSPEMVRRLAIASALAGTGTGGAAAEPLR